METLAVIAVILTVLIARPLWRVVALRLWNDGIVPLILTVILLAAFVTILILATKIPNAWLLGAVWTVTIALFVGVPIFAAISDYYHNVYKSHIVVRKLESSVENGAPDKEIRRRARKVNNGVAFHTFVQNNRFDLARELLEKGEYSIEGSFRLLSNLIYDGSEEANVQAAFLLDNGVPPHYFIRSAIHRNNIDGLKLLLQHGANANEKTVFDKETPLCYAKREGASDEIIALLLEYGAVCEGEN